MINRILFKAYMHLEGDFLYQRGHITDVLFLFWLQGRVTRGAY